MTSITPFLWFDNNVREAVAFYTSVFPNAKVETVNDFMAGFELEGQRFHALNGGPKFRFNEAVSFFISVESQQEVDYFWNRLIADGGEESKCGWLKDRFGLSWQVVPKTLGRYLGDSGRYREDLCLLAGEAIEAGGTPPMPVDPVAAHSSVADVQKRTLAAQAERNKWLAFMISRRPRLPARRSRCSGSRVRFS